MNSGVGASGLTLPDDRDPDHDGLDLLLDDDADGDGPHKGYYAESAAMRT